MAEVYPDDLQHTRYPLLTDAQCAADPLVDGAGGIYADTNVCAGFPEDYYIATCSVSEKFRIFLAVPRIKHGCLDHMYNYFKHFSRIYGFKVC